MYGKFDKWVSAGSVEPTVSMALSKICRSSVCSSQGWTHPLQKNGFSCDLWAGAAKCDTSKGSNAGTAAFAADGKTFSIALGSGWSLKNVHFYHGIDKYPKRGTTYTVAPGQYSPNYVYSPDSAGAYTIINGGLKASEYFILHTEVCKRV